MKKVCYLCGEEIARKEIPFWEKENGHSHTKCKDVVDLVRSNEKIRERVKKVLDELKT